MLFCRCYSLLFAFPAPFSTRISRNHACKQDTCHKKPDSRKKKVNEDRRGGLCEICCLCVFASIGFPVSVPAIRPSDRPFSQYLICSYKLADTQPTDKVNLVPVRINMHKLTLLRFDIYAKNLWMLMCWHGGRLKGQEPDAAGKRTCLNMVIPGGWTHVLTGISFQD